MDRQWFPNGEVMEKTGLMEELLRDIEAKYGSSPFYLYEQNIMDRQADLLLENFLGIEFLYSVKANPFPPVVKWAAARGFGADAASAAEVGLARSAGAAPADVFYSAPGKTKSDLEGSLDECTLIADSFHELGMLDALAAGRKTPLDIGLRLNPDFAMGGGPGLSSKFGLDAETLPDHREFLIGLRHLRIIGLHVHLRSQVLYDPALARYYDWVLTMADSCRREWNWPLRFVNFGGGLGLPYSAANDHPLNVARLGTELEKLARAHRERLGPVRLFIETGRFLVGEAGGYFTPVVDIKESRGHKYLVVKNGLNGFLRPALAELLAASGCPQGAPTRSLEPLFTVRDAFDFSLVGKSGDQPRERVSVVGNLCTAMDVLAEGLSLPRAAIGDWVRVSKAGVYAYSLSPLAFSSQPPPRQIFVDSHGVWSED